MREIPNELAALILLKHRTSLDKYQIASFEQLQRGFIGELTLDKWIAEFGDTNWIVLKDIFIKVHNAVSQIDTIIITPSNVYVIDVKNYTGEYRLEAGGWWYWDKMLDYNPLNQLNEAVKNINTIFKKEKLPYQSTGILTFISVHAKIDIVDPSRHKIIKYNEISSWLRTTKSNDKAINFAGKKIVRAISKYIIPNYHDNYSTKYASLKTGLNCPSCRSFAYTVANKVRYIQCGQCGARHLKTELTYQMIIEYAVLNGDKELTTNEIYDFLAGQISHRTIRNILNQKFTRIGKGRQSRYTNPHPKLNHLVQL